MSSEIKPEVHFTETAQRSPGRVRIRRPKGGFTYTTGEGVTWSDDVTYSGTWSWGGGESILNSSAPETIKIKNT